MEKFKVIIVEDVPLELKGTEGISVMKSLKRRSLEQQRTRLHTGN